MLKIKEKINKMKNENRKLEKKYKNINNILEEYFKILKTSIPDFKENKFVNLLKKYNIDINDFNKYLNNDNFIKSFYKIRKKFNLDNNKINKIFHSEDILIFLDYDEILVDLLDEWLKEYNILINMWIKNNKNKKFKDKSEILQNFLNFFSKKNRGYYKKLGYNVYGKNEDYLLDKNFTIEKIDSNFKNKLWESYNKNKKFNFTKKDITNFYIFNSLPLGFNFLEGENIYMNEDYSKNRVKPYKDSVVLYNFLVENDLIKKTYILTSSFHGTEYSKFQQVKKNFPLLENRIITTSNKSEAILKTGKGAILYDDAIHNHLNTLKENDTIYTVLRTFPHNKYLGTGKRICRVNNSIEFIELLPLLHLQVFERIMDKKLKLDNNINSSVLLSF